MSEKRTPHPCVRQRVSGKPSGLENEVNSLISGAAPVSGDSLADGESSSRRVTNELPDTGAAPLIGGVWWNLALPSFETAVILLIASRALGAFFAPISDCDEVFNYWEPLHFSMYGSGARTWEYSPQFALRSWVYILMHSLNAAVFRFIYADPLCALFQTFGTPPPKVCVFYLVRLSLVAVSSTADASLYWAVAQHLSPRGPRRARAIAVLVLLCTSCGLVANSCAFLPSSMAMYLTSTALAALLNLPEKGQIARERGRARSISTDKKTDKPINNTRKLREKREEETILEDEDTLEAERDAGMGRRGTFFEEQRDMRTCIFCMVIGVVIAWPFVGLLALPMAYVLLFRVSVMEGAGGFSFWTLAGTALTSTLFIAIPMFLIESWIYGGPAFPPLNIVLYNVFGIGGNSSLYGTEPPWFYIANLAINFGLALPLCLLLPPILLLNHLLLPPAPAAASASAKSDWHLLCWISPLYLWILFLSCQSHKEERFMFVVYPLVATAAGIALVEGANIVADLTAAWLKWLQGEWKHTLIARAIVCSVLVVSILLGASRFMTLATSFDAPIKVWRKVGEVLPQYAPAWGNLDAPLTVCVAKEWYRFPGHLLVDFPASSGYSDASEATLTAARSWKLGYLKSEFDGQLPGEFQTILPGCGPTDPKNFFQGRLIAARHADTSFNSFNKEVTSRYVEERDCHLLIDRSSVGQREKHYELDPDWQVLWEHPFLDLSQSHFPYKTFYIPGLSNRKNTYNKYLLLRNTKATRLVTRLKRET